MIRTVIFDLGGVIVPLDFPRAYQALSDACGIDAGEIPGRIRATGLVPRYESGEMTDAEFVQHFCQALGVSIAMDEFRTLWSSLFHPHTLIPESLLVGLRRNYRLVLLSNTNNLHFELLEQNYPLLGHFDSFVLSYRVGAVKPSPKIYAEAIHRAGCAPEECFYTDDIPQYIEGARLAGIDAVQFHSHEQIVGEMERRGIVIG